MVSSALAIRSAVCTQRLSLRATVGQADSKPAVGLFRRELLGETNDNSVAILLTHGTARVLLAGDAEAKEEYVAGDLYTGSLIVINVPKLPTLSQGSVPC